MTRQRTAVDLVVEWSPRGLVAFDAKTKQLASFDTATELAASLGAREALVAPSRRSTFVRSVRVPNATPEEIRAVLQVKMVDLFPVPPQDIAYDYVLTDDVTEEGRLAIVGAMPAAELRRMLEEFKSASIRVRGVVPAAFGAPLLVSDLNRKNGAVVQRTAEGLSIDIVWEGMLRYTRLASAASPIEAEVCRTFQVAGIPCSDIIAAGGLDVPEADLTTLETTLQALGHGWPLSLGLDLELPEVVIARHASQLGGKRRFAALLSVSALLMVGYVVLDRTDAAALVAAQQRKDNAAVDKLKRAESVVESQAVSARKLQASLDLGFDPAQRMSDILTVVSNYTPPGIWLTGMTLERGKALMIRGTAQNSNQIADYQSKLIADPRFRDVKLVFATNALIDVTPVVQFSISAFPVGNLPLVDQGTKAGARK